MKVLLYQLMMVDLMDHNPMYSPNQSTYVVLTTHEISYCITLLSLGLFWKTEKRFQTNVLEVFKCVHARSKPNYQKRSNIHVRLFSTGKCKPLFFNRNNSLKLWKIVKRNGTEILNHFCLECLSTVFNWRWTHHQHKCQ